VLELILGNTCTLGISNVVFILTVTHVYPFSKNESKTPWLRENDTDENNKKAKKAYEALMTVTLRKPTSPEYKNFSMEVKRRAKIRYTNFTYGEEEVNIDVYVCLRHHSFTRPFV